MTAQPGRLTGIDGYLARLAILPLLATGLVTGVLLLVVLIKTLDFGVRFTAWAATPIQVGAFLAFAALVLRMYYVAAYRVGGEPLWLVYEVAARLRGLVSRRGAG